jgi:hypothetical protein
MQIIAEFLMFLLSRKRLWLWSLFVFVYPEPVFVSGPGIGALFQSLFQTILGSTELSRQHLILKKSLIPHLKQRH